MNTPSITEKSNDVALLDAGSGVPEQLEEPWFDAAPPSSQCPSVAPVSIGAFLGDPLADAWLR